MKLLEGTGRSAQTPQGFTLLEVLVSMVIVSLVIVVYLQLMSSGMKLEYKSREKIDKLLIARQIFDSLSLQDVRAEDFSWEGETGNFTWNLKIQAIDVQNATMDEDIAFKKQSELYKYTFQFFDSGQKLVDFIRYASYKPDFFSQEFKDEHFQ